MIFIEKNLKDALGGALNDESKYLFDTLEMGNELLSTYSEKYELLILSIKSALDKKNKQTKLFLEALLETCSLAGKKVVLFEVVSSAGERNKMEKQVSALPVPDDLDINALVVIHKKSFGKSTPVDLSALLEMIETIDVSSEIKEVVSEYEEETLTSDDFDTLTLEHDANEEVEEVKEVEEVSKFVTPGAADVEAMLEEDDNPKYRRREVDGTGAKETRNEDELIPVKTETFEELKRRFLEGKDNATIQSISSIIENQTSVEGLLSILNENSSYMSLTRNLNTIRQRLLEAQVNQTGGMADNFTIVRSLVSSSMEAMSERDKLMAASFIDLLNTIMDSVGTALLEEEKRIMSFKIKTLDFSNHQAFSSTLVKSLLEENSALMEKLVGNKNKTADVYESLLLINDKVSEIVKNNLEEAKNDYYTMDRRHDGLGDYVSPDYNDIFQMINDNKGKLIIQRNSADEVANQSITILSSIVTNMEHVLMMLMENSKVKQNFSIASLTGNVINQDSSMISIYTGSRGSGLTTTSYVCSVVQEHLYATLHIDLSPATFETLKSMHSGLIIPLGDALANEDMVRPLLGSKAPVVIAGTMNYDSTTLNKLLSLISIASTRFRKINVVIPGGKSSQKVEEILSDMISVVNIVTTFKPEAEKFAFEALKAYEGKKVVKRVIYSNYNVATVPIELIEKYDEAVINKALIRLTHVPSLPYISNQYIKGLPVTENIFDDLRLRSILHENLC